MSRVPSAKARSASPRAAANASLNSAAPRTMRMPRPPPPAEALIRIGKPSFEKSLSVAAGTTGTLASRAILRASALEPIARFTLEGGPRWQQLTEAAVASFGYLEAISQIGLERARLQPCRCERGELRASARKSISVLNTRG